MANLRPFFAEGTFAGQLQRLWVPIVFYTNVGSGRITTFADYSVAFTGKMNTVFYSGAINLELTLRDNNPTSKRGLCSLIINSVEAERAAYVVQGEKLVVDAIFSGRVQNIVIRSVNEGRETELRLSGIYNYSLRLVPTGTN